MNMSPVAESHRFPPRSTSRALWWLAMGVLMGTVALRVPQLRNHVTDLLAGNPSVAAELTDEGLRTLAINIGIALAIILTAVLAFTYQSLGRALERHFFQPGVSVGGGQRAGLYFLVSCACTIPVQLFCVTTGALSVKDSSWFYAYVVAVSLAIVIPFRSRISRLPVGRKVLFVGVTVLYGVLSAAL